MATFMHCSGMQREFTACLIFEWHMICVCIPAIMSHCPQVDYTECSIILRSLFLAWMTLFSNSCDTNIYLNIYLKLIINKQ